MKTISKKWLITGGVIVLFYCFFSYYYMPEKANYEVIYETGNIRYKKGASFTKEKIKSIARPITYLYATDNRALVVSHGGKNDNFFLLYDENMNLLYQQNFIDYEYVPLMHVFNKHFIKVYYLNETDWNNTERDIIFIDMDGNEVNAFNDFFLRIGNWFY